MQAYVGVITLCMVSGILSCIIHEICAKDRTGANKDKSYINHIIKTTVFYIVIFHTILSLFKVLLGNGTLTLIESFDEVSWRTYLHYSLPLIVIAISAPFILRKILREKTDSFVLMALSLITLMYSIVYLIFARINNIWCTCIAAVGIGLALLAVYFYKGKVGYCNHKSWKKRLKVVVPIILFWAVLMILYLPNELYLGNLEDIDVPYHILVSTLLIGAFAYFAVYTFISVYFLTAKQFSLACEAIFAIALSCYIQGIALNGEIGVMDGSVQTWPVMTMVVNALIWVVIIGVVISLKFIIKKNIDKTYSMICIYLALIQLVTWGYLRLTTDLAKTENDLELTTEARFELDSEHNVLVFVLDWFDGQILDRVIDEQEDFLEPLSDFTWYKNTSSAYAFTTMALPYLLTGVEWQYDMLETDYRDYAFENDTLLHDIKDKNYDIGIYTLKKLMAEDAKDIVRNYSDITVQGWDYLGIFNQMLSCSKYNSYPYALKNRYWYADGDIARAMRKTGVHSITDDAPFYYELITDGLQVRTSDKYGGAYRFYHLRGMHTPFEPDMISQGKYCMNIIYEYLRQLKEAGLYDEATIIITADHGQNYIASDEKLSRYDFDKASSPILFVKKSGQVNEAGPRVSMAPVSHAEMAASVMEAVCGDTMGYGDAFDDIDEDVQRERYFIYRRFDDIPYTKYAINGYVRDWDNWSLEEAD